MPADPTRAALHALRDLVYYPEVLSDARREHGARGQGGAA